MKKRPLLLFLLLLCFALAACREAPAPPPPKPVKPTVKPVIPPLETAELAPFVPDLQKILAAVDDSGFAKAREKASHGSLGVAAAYDGALPPAKPEEPKGGKACQTKVLAALDTLEPTRAGLASAGLALPDRAATGHASTVQAIACLDRVVHATHATQTTLRHEGDVAAATALEDRIQMLGAVATELKKLRGGYAEAIQRLLGAVSPAVRYHTVAAVAKKHRGLSAANLGTMLNQISLARATVGDPGIRQATSDRIDELRASLTQPAPAARKTPPANKAAGGVRQPPGAQPQK